MVQRYEHFSKYKKYFAEVIIIVPTNKSKK